MACHALTTLSPRHRGQCEKPPGPESVAALKGEDGGEGEEGEQRLRVRRREEYRRRVHAEEQRRLEGRIDKEVEKKASMPPSFKV